MSVLLVYFNLRWFSLAGKNAESTGDGLSKIDLSSSKKDGKEMLNDIASFMKGFMNVLNIKSEG